MGCIVQVVNLSGTCLCVSGVVSSFPAAIERATITSAVFGSGVNVLPSDIVATNPPAFMIIEASFGADVGNSHLQIVMTNGASSFTTQLAHGDLSNFAGGEFTSEASPNEVIQHAPLLLHSGDAMNIQFDNTSTFLHILRITETNTVVGR